MGTAIRRVIRGVGMNYFDIAPETNADRINLVVNDQSVYPWIKGRHEGSFDLSPIVQNKDNIVLMGEHGGIIFIKHQAGVYECHTNVLPAGRGPWVQEHGHLAMRWMFAHTDAYEIMTKCPKSNPMAAMAARSCGFVKDFTTRPLWATPDGTLVCCDVYSLNVQQWARSDPSLPIYGKQFHIELESQYRRMGKSLPIHDDDEMHDRYVGGTMLMLDGRQPLKAIVFYNRWAKMSGYEPISLVSVSPLVVDIAQSKLRIWNKSFEVL